MYSHYLPILNRRSFLVVSNDPFSKKDVPVTISTVWVSTSIKAAHSPKSVKVVIQLTITDLLAPRSAYVVTGCMRSASILSIYSWLCSVAPLPSQVLIVVHVFALLCLQWWKLQETKGLSEDHFRIVGLSALHLSRSNWHYSESTMGSGGGGASGGTRGGGKSWYLPVSIGMRSLRESLYCQRIPNQIPAPSLNPQCTNSWSTEWNDHTSAHLSDFSPPVKPPLRSKRCRFWIGSAWTGWGYLADAYEQIIKVWKLDFHTSVPLQLVHRLSTVPWATRIILLLNLSL